MASQYTTQLAYGYRRYLPVITTASDDTAALARVEQLLLAAGTAYRSRQYTAALQAYQDARGLLWTQLFPLTRFDEVIAQKTALFTTLVSYAAEWLNVLPVEQAVSGVRPRETVTVDAPVLGLLSAATGSVASAALADYQLSTALVARGNPVSAQFFHDRAMAQAPDLITRVSAEQTPPLSPVTPPAAPLAHPLPPGPLGPVLLPHGVGAPLVGADIGALRLGTSLSGSLVTRTIGTRLVPSLDVPPVVVPPDLTVDKRTYAVSVADRVEAVVWAAGAAAPTDALVGTVYTARKVLLELPDVLIKPARAADVAVSLAHAWYYETTLGIAECQHALGAWAEAETWYLRAAGYEYLNAAIEAPYVWTRLATLYLDWGDALLRDDDPASALPVYEKVLHTDGTAPSSALYTTPGLAPAATDARTAIGELADPATITVNPAIAAVLYDVQAQLAKIAGGLDFWGHWAANVPIWTFDYLQSVAVGFAQLAIGAERDAIGFWEKADSGELTRTQLTQSVQVAGAEQQAAQQAVGAAAAEAGAYQAGRDVAALRATDATANADAYASKSASWTMHQALQTQLSGDEDGDASQLNQLADRMAQGGYSLSGDAGTLAAAEALTAARMQAGYEADTLRRQAGELTAAVHQADLEVAAAHARVTAAQASAHASAVRVGAAQQLLAAFDEQRFTPDVWNAMGERMQSLSQRYLVWALDVAKRMQRAYNFENDVEVHAIRPDYAADAVHGLLAADSLMADIQSFTYDLVMSTAPKTQPIKQTISLAQRYPYLFETALRRTGTIDFATDLADFDDAYPGTYAGRIEHIEVAVDGIVPPRGVSGTLTNVGISHYRTPASAGGAVKHRVQSRETQVISDFDVRADALVDVPDRRRTGIFEGAGIASAWTLSLPPGVNDLDFATLTDVRLTVTYRARFDPDLRAGVLAELAARPQVHERMRPLPLRWTVADAFFAFYGSGVLDFSLGRGDFAVTEYQPVLTTLSLVCATTPRTRIEGIVLKVTAPGSTPVTVTTGPDGVVEAAALAGAVTGQAALGDYRIELAAADNPGWVTDGHLTLDDIDNIALVLGYSFTPRG
ncbi:MAG: hypothetical protein M3Y71_15695 [Actinomycetota bacterium]|nr:hypothetical protein [Actinomycetota bacterium]